MKQPKSNKTINPAYLAFLTFAIVYMCLCVGYILKTRTSGVDSLGKHIHMCMVAYEIDRTDFNQEDFEFCKDIPQDEMQYLYNRVKSGGIYE